MAYVPSLHSSDHSHPTEELPASHNQGQYATTTSEPFHTEAHPSLLDKAKAYIPVLGSSTEFDPAAEARLGQEDRLYQEPYAGQAGFAPEQVPHESLLDKARAYGPAMGAPGTTTAGIDVSLALHSQLLHIITLTAATLVTRVCASSQYSCQTLCLLDGNVLTLLPADLSACETSCMLSGPPSCALHLMHSLCMLQLCTSGSHYIMQLLFDLLNIQESCVSHKAKMHLAFRGFEQVPAY